MENKEEKRNGRDLSQEEIASLVSAANFDVPVQPQ